MDTRSPTECTSIIRSSGHYRPQNLPLLTTSWPEVATCQSASLWSLILLSSCCCQARLLLASPLPSPTCPILTSRSVLFALKEQSHTVLLMKNIVSDNFHCAWSLKTNVRNTIKVMSWAEKSPAVIVPPVWTGMLSAHRSGLLSTTGLSENSGQSMVRIVNPGNDCYIAGAINLMFSSPAFLTFLATVDTDLIPGKGDVVRELRNLTSLGRLQVNYHH